VDLVDLVQGEFFEGEEMAAGPGHVEIYDGRFTNCDLPEGWRRP
jgi:hypothetical protein